ncbi:DNA-binding domain [Trinorchestia longiramus]|nr:DNA-binding domain [Trinorchestia longiramus]
MYASNCADEASSKSTSSMRPANTMSMTPGHAMNMAPPGGSSLSTHGGMNMMPMSMASSNNLSMTLSSGMGPVQNSGPNMASHGGMNVIPNNGTAANTAMHMPNNANMPSSIAMNMMPSNAVNMMQPSPAMSMVPNNTANMMHNNAMNMVPNNALNMVPNNAVNMVPNNAMNMVPSNTVNMVPNNTANMVPNNPMNMVPNNGVNMGPNSAMSLVPNNGVNMVPYNTMNVIPNNTMNMVPNNAMNMMPNNSMNMMPSNSMSMMPNNAMYVSSNNVVSVMSNNASNMNGNHAMHRSIKKCMNVQQHNVMNANSNIPVTSFSPSVMNVQTSTSSLPNNIVGTSPNSVNAVTSNVTNVSSSSEHIMLPKGELNAPPNSSANMSLTNCMSNMSTTGMGSNSGRSVGMGMTSSDGIGIASGSGLMLPHNSSMDMTLNNGMNMPLGPGMNMPPGNGMNMCHPRMVCGPRIPNAAAGSISNMMGCGGPENGCSTYGNLMASPPSMRAPGAITGAGCAPGGAPLMHCVDARNSNSNLAMHYKGSNMAGVHVREPFMDNSGASCGQPSQHYCQQPFGYQSHMGHYAQLRPMQHQLMCQQQYMQHPESFMCNSMVNSVRPQLNNSKVMQVNGSVQNHSYMHCRTNSSFYYNGYVSGGNRVNACGSSKPTNVGEIRSTSRESPRCDSACSSHSETGSFIRSVESHVPVCDNSNASMAASASPATLQTMNTSMPPSTNQVFCSELQISQNRSASSKLMLPSDSVSVLHGGNKSSGLIQNSDSETNLNNSKNHKDSSFHSASAPKDYSEGGHLVTDTKSSSITVENSKTLASNSNSVTQPVANLDVDPSVCHKTGKSCGQLESISQFSPSAPRSCSSEEWHCSSKQSRCEPSASEQVLNAESHETEQQGESTAGPPSDSQNLFFNTEKSNSSIGQCGENDSNKSTFDGASVDSGVDSSVRSGSSDSVQIVGGALTPNHSMVESPTMCKVVCTSSQTNVVPSTKECHGYSANVPSFANASHNLRDQVYSANNFYSGVSTSNGTAAFAGPGLSQTSFVIVPFGWRRIISANRVLYISPSGNELSSVSAVSQYLTTEGTCKCGLQCPLKVASVFCFDPSVPDRPTLPAELTNRDVLQSCTHRRKLAAAFTKHMNSTRQQHLALQQQPARPGREAMCHYNHPPSNMTMQSHACYAGAVAPPMMHQVPSVAACDQQAVACAKAKCIKNEPHAHGSSCGGPQNSACCYVSQANISGSCEHSGAETLVTASNLQSCASSTASSSACSGEAATSAGSTVVVASAVRSSPVPTTVDSSAVANVNLTSSTAGSSLTASTVYSPTSTVCSTASTVNFSSTECSLSRVTVNSAAQIADVSASGEHSSGSNVCSTLIANAAAASVSFNNSSGNLNPFTVTSNASIVSSIALNASLTTASGNSNAFSENSCISNAKPNANMDTSGVTIESSSSGSTIPADTLAVSNTSGYVVTSVSSSQLPYAPTTCAVHSLQTRTSPSSKDASLSCSSAVVQVANSCYSTSAACGPFYSSSNLNAISGTSMSIVGKSRTLAVSSADASVAHSLSETDPSLMNVLFPKSTCVSSSTLTNSPVQFPTSTTSNQPLSTASSSILPSSISVQSSGPVTSSLLSNISSSEMNCKTLSMTPAAVVMSPLTCSESVSTTRVVVTSPTCSVSLVASAAASGSAFTSASTLTSSSSLSNSLLSCESKPVDASSSSAGSESLTSASPSPGHPQHHMQLGQQKHIMMMKPLQEQHIIMQPQGIIPQQTYSPQQQMMLQNQHFEQRGYVPPQHQMQDSCRPPFFRSSMMMPRNVMMRGPFMPPAGAYRVPLGPRMGCKPVWPLEDEKSTGVKRRRGGCGRTRKRAKAADESASVLAPPCSSTVPSFLEDPNAYLAQQTAMLNSTMAGGPGQFSPQGSATIARHARPTELERAGPVVNLVASGALASPSTENSSTSTVTLPSSMPSFVSQSPISSSTAISDLHESFPSTSLSDSKNIEQSPSVVCGVTSGSFPQQKSNVNQKLSTPSSIKTEPQFSYTSSGSVGTDAGFRLAKSSPRLPSLPARPRSSSPRISGRSSTFTINQSLQSSAPQQRTCSSSQKQPETQEGRPSLASPEPSTTSSVGSSTGCALGVQLQCDSASSRGYLKNELSDKKHVDCSELNSMSNFNCTTVDKKPVESKKFQKQKDWSVKISTARSGIPASNDQVSSSGKACSISPTASTAPKKCSSQDRVVDTVDSSQIEVEPSKRSWLSASSSRVGSLSQPGGTEMLAIRSHVLRASPTSNFDLEKEDTQDTDGGDDDCASNDTSDVEDTCSNSTEVLSASSVVASGSQSKHANREVAKTSGSSTFKSTGMPRLMDTRVSCSVSAACDNDDSNKPLSPGPISSTCSQTPLEMVQNIVSSIPLPPVSHPCASVSAFPSDCISCTLPSGSTASSRQTPPCLTQTAGAPQAALAAPLHHGLYEGVVRSGILVQQPTVAVSSSSVVVVGPKHPSHVTSLSALQPVQPLVHLVNPFPSATPLIIQQTAGIGNISNLGNISAICSNAQLLPSSGAAFVASQHASTQASSSARTPLPLGSSSPQLQVAQVVTTDGYIDGTSSPSGSSTVSTPHATPPDLAPSPQPARKRRRRRNSSASQATANILPTLIVGSRPQQPQQQQLMMAGAQQRFTSQASGVGAHQVITSASGGNMIAASAATAINVVQMVGPSMGGTLTAGTLQPPAILVGSSGAPGVILPSDATFLSTDPNTCLTYPVQIVGVTAAPAQQVVAVRPPPPPSDGSKVVTCLSSPPTASNSGVHLYAHNASQAVVSARSLGAPAAMLASDYLTYQQHVFMQQPIVAKTSIAGISPQRGTVVSTGQQLQLSSSISDGGHSVSISTQTLQSEGENCDVSSTGDVQQSRISSASSVSPNSPSHQSAEVTTTRLDEEPQCVSTPHKPPSADSVSSAATPPPHTSGWW